MYDLHSLHGQFSSCHFVISSLKARNDISFLNSLGAIFQIFRPRKEILSVPQKNFLPLVIQIVKTLVNYNHYSFIVIIVPR